MKDFLLTTFELPACVKAEYYDSVDMFTRESIWQLCYRDLSKHDVKIASEEELSELCLNTDTIFPERLRGMACAGFLSGATCGVAPESELVYFAIPNATLDREAYFGYQLEALKMIIEYNQTHASRIRVVSLSAGYEKSQWERRNELEKQVGHTILDVETILELA
ncbi:MAG: hypothetical protein IKS10_02125 [Lachnospiraceae bacterium]|nr:hypothetical protein [Lachnospiraceae bacterium]